MQLNINTDEVVKFTNTLEKIHKSALPSAIRGALNDAAFDVKTKTMLKSSAASFKNRSKNFFKANSKFVNAKGFDIKTMKSEVGFFENKLVNQSTNFSVKDLEEQEKGGTISNKSFIAMKKARVGNSNTKNVRPNFRLSQIRNVIDVRKVKAKTKKQQYIKAAFIAEKKYGKNAFILGNTWGRNERTLSRVDEIWGSSRHGSRALQVHRTPLYTFRHGRKITVGGTNFMQRASFETTLSIEKFYVIQAIRQLKKFIK
jgi:hypothetical protein